MSNVCPEREEQLSLFTFRSGIIVLNLGNTVVVMNVKQVMFPSSVSSLWQCGLPLYLIFISHAFTAARFHWSSVPLRF